MVKKLLLASMIVLGLIYGSGSDLASVKSSILGAADGQARGVSASPNRGWGDDSGF
jgi:hypothetical protein